MRCPVCEKSELRKGKIREVMFGIEWRLGKTTKIAKAGNSVVVRIPKPVVEFLKIKVGQEAFIQPEKDKLIIETR